jgi:hypothetical protein
VRQLPTPRSTHAPHLAVSHHALTAPQPHCISQSTDYARMEESEGLLAVIRNLDIYGQAISDVRFLVLRSEVHLRMLASQRSDLPRRMRSRVTRGTCSVLEFIKRLGFRRLAHERERVHWFSSVLFLPTVLCRGTHRNSIQFAMYYSAILPQSSKSGNGREVYGKEEKSMFQRTGFNPSILDVVGVSLYCVIPVSHREPTPFLSQLLF